MSLVYTLLGVLFFIFVVAIFYALWRYYTADNRTSSRVAGGGKVTLVDDDQLTNTEAMVSIGAKKSVSTGKTTGYFLFKVLYNEKQHQQEQQEQQEKKEEKQEQEEKEEKTPRPTTTTTPIETKEKNTELFEINAPISSLTLKHKQDGFKVEGEDEVVGHFTAVFKSPNTLSLDWDKPMKLGDSDHTHIKSEMTTLFNVEIV